MKKKQLMKCKATYYLVVKKASSASLLRIFSRNLFDKTRTKS